MKGLGFESRKIVGKQFFVKNSFRKNLFKMLYTSVSVCPHYIQKQMKVKQQRSLNGLNGLHIIDTETILTSIK